MRSARAWDSRCRRSASSSVSSLVCPSRHQTLQTMSGLWMATSCWLSRCLSRTRRRRTTTTTMTTMRSMGRSLVFPLFSPLADAQVVPLRELPAGLGVYVCSLGERSAPPSSPGRRLLKCRCFQRLAWSACGYTLMRQFYATLGRSFRWYFYGPLYLAVTCSLWFLPEEYSTWFWEMTSGNVVFRASWFDSGYACVSPRRLLYEFPTFSSWV